MRGLNIAVVGGGLGGLSCAAKVLELLPQARAMVFDMGMRGPGGRASTRRLQDGKQFDHGLQFVRLDDDGTAGDLTAVNDLRQQLSMWQKAEAAAPWRGRFGSIDAPSGIFLPAKGAWIDRVSSGSTASSTADSAKAASVSGSGFCDFLQGGRLFVGVPSNDALCTSLAAMHPERLSHAWATKVTEVREAGCGQWEILGVHKAEDEPSEAALGAFDAVILSDAMAGRLGSPGHIRLKSPALRQLTGDMAAAKAAPRISLMMALSRGTVRPPFDAACVRGCDTIEWLCCDSVKPGRSTQGDDCWTAVSTEAYALRVLHKQPLQVDGRFNPSQPQIMAHVAKEMSQAVCSILARYPAAPSSDSQTLEPTYAAAQRWGSCLYPTQAAPLGTVGPVIAATAAGGAVAATGDWLAGSNAEAVIRHAHKTARRLATALAMDA